MSNHISISLELISLINWLMKNEKAMLHSLIKHAIKNGFAQELEKVEALESSKTTEQLYTSVLDFLVFLEDTLIQHLESGNFDPQSKEAMLPALQKLTNESLNDKTIWLSMQQAQHQLSKAAREETTHTPKTEQEKKAAGVLVEQLLKNWEPSNKDSVN
ncbi:MAG: hypothetical protein H6679_05280 [Epsilonproteobacteria bacterium]|nr:hypothetical protein [Campylobacterota bacterium]